MFAFDRKFVGTAALMFLLIGTPLCAADFSTYRGLKFGESVTAAEKQAGARPNAVRTLHTRPAKIQEVDWQPQSVGLKPDPVKDGLLYFLNGDLFRIAITYDRYKTEGMTADDLIDAISVDYGKPSRPAQAEVPYHSIYGETAKVVARWEDPDYSFDLVTNGDRAGFAMVLYSKKSSALADASILESIRLDASEAPQRELDKEKKRTEDERVILEKARLLNKPNFQL